MSPKSSKKDRAFIIENFRLGLKEKSEEELPLFFKIDSSGTITHLPESSKGFFLENLEVNCAIGDSCFDLIPNDRLTEFTTRLSSVFSSMVPSDILLPFKGSGYRLFLTPLFSNSGIVENVQILILKEPNLKPALFNSHEISPDIEQQFIYKLIRSLAKGPDLKLGFSKVIRQISGFLNFDFAEAWEVGLDSKSLYKSATFSREDTIWDNEGEKTFKKGEGLPGNTLEAQKVVVWERLQNDSRFIRKSNISKNEITTGIGIPIIYENEVIAVLTFFCTDRENTDHLQKILERISFQISPYVKRNITENQLNNMFRFSPNLIAIVGLDGFLKKVNPSFIKIFGFSEEKLLTTPFSEFLHKDDKFSTHERLREVASGLSPRSFQNRCLTSSGAYKWVSWTPFEFMDEEGVVHVSGMDISFFKSTNLELIKYRNIVESSKDGIGLFTLETEEIFFNKAFTHNLGYSEEELKSPSAVKKIYENNELSSEIYKTILKGNFWEGDLKLLDAGGKFLDYHFRGGPILNENKEIIAIFGLHTDISDRKKHESSLKEYGARINNVLESITDGFFFLNANGEVTYWNKAAEDLLQIPRNKILGKILWDFFPVERDPVFFQKYQEAKSTNKRISFEHYVQYMGLWVEVNVYPGKDGLSTYFKDISDRKKVEEETRIAKERYDLVSKATREAVYDWDIANNLLDWSNSYYEIYGYERVSAFDSLSQWEQQIHKDDRQRVVIQMHSAMEGRDYEWTCEYRLIRPDRKIAMVLERGYIIRNEMGKAIRMIGSLQDITTLKQNERALEELNHELKKHSAELVKSNAELEQFAYIASHDLQEPLRMVTSFLTLLEKKYEGKLDEKAGQYIHYATDGAYRMRQIILDLLEYSRIGKFNYDLELVDLNVMIRDIIKLYEPQILEKNARIQFQDLQVIKAAKVPLQRVLSNLISNSIKYSREDIPPVIEISIENTATHWEFIIEDNGIGIDEQFREKIFIIFQRLHSRDQYSGTGIGLAICKKIAENHGGKIWVESGKETGSTFHFTIQKHF